MVWAYRERSADDLTPVKVLRFGRGGHVTAGSRRAGTLRVRSALPAGMTLRSCALDGD